MFLQNMKVKYLILRKIYRAFDIYSRSYKLLYCFKSFLFFAQLHRIYFSRVEIFHERSFPPR